MRPHRSILRTGCVHVVLLLAVCSRCLGAQPFVDYHAQIEPLFRIRCYECHSGHTSESGLDLTSKDTALRRADSGQFAISPGNVEGSTLWNRVNATDVSERMPPEGEPLTESEKDLVRRWIEAGAYWPESEVSSDLHWAYVPPTKSRPPAASTLPNFSSWARNALDLFTLKRMSDAGLTPSPESGPARLIRRLHLDLIGLPPPLDTVNAFVANPTDHHYERIVQQLLASPRYGEKWARHWLDLARYSDSNGYQADQIREMWAFRDWVIAAMNGDMPYDQFTVEQLAGDLLPNATHSQQVATGFHRATTCNVEAGVDPEENRTNQVIDRVNTTGTTWLGTTLECAQCHNHKYDPISQEEYYQLFAFFNNTPIEVAQDSPGSVSFSMAGPELELPISKTARLRLNRIRARKTLVQERIEKANRKTATGQDTSDLETLKKQLANLEKDEAQAAPPTTMVMLELKEPRQTTMFVRGEFLSPGAKVEAGVPAIFNQFPSDVPRNRISFAAWLVDSANPLTARVAVNRWWQELFGRGIVSTLDDFGTQGARPTHPQLLDWLAVTLQDNDWSMKSIHRLIVTSSTYRQSSAVTGQQVAADPENVWLARGPKNRLPAELIRDNALAISGLLQCQMEGPPIYPPQPDGLWHQTGRNEPVFAAATDQNRFRRGIYVVWRRAAPYPSFVTFDAPDRMTCVAQRPNTNTPLQALTLLNDEAYAEIAKAMAARIIRETSDRSLPSKVEYAIRLALARAPASREIELLQSLYEKEFADLREHPNRAKALARKFDPVVMAVPEKTLEWAAWFSVCNAVLNLDETISK